MTSTVLDVTVLLLCVSASVVALGAAGGDPGAERRSAGEVADRIATETVTVTYGSAEAPTDTRTVHATRAELLALLVARGEGDGGSDAANESFESAARTAIGREVGPRTRIDAKAEGADPAPVAGETTDDTDATESERGRRSKNATEVPIRGVTLRRLVPRTGGGRRATAAGSGVPRRVAHRHREASDAGSDRRADAVDPTDSVAVGSDPPRSADVTAAVVTHPAPDAEGSDGPVTIVVRRW
ncbi:DUF7284 family protein [Halorubrum amylolyticum]|uniref:DUF7284 family protein n=1 Tax=Halorubrum amylolyticum TaxID=2508724 RepID=UPI001009227A|nr:hypothetical protein [Halorubrum amylolyticum]